MLCKLRYDKYERKTKYWVEEDLEFEWEKSQSREIQEEQNFDLDNGNDDLPDMGGLAVPLQADLSVAAAGGLHTACLNQLVSCMTAPFQKLLSGPFTSAPSGPPPKTPAANTLLPTVLKTEQPSVCILKYMEGLTKRMNKMEVTELMLHVVTVKHAVCRIPYNVTSCCQDTKKKYDEIPAAAKTDCHTQRHG